MNQEKYKTTEERVNALNSWCLHTTCDRCNKPKSIGCCIYWLSLEAEEEKPEPCPFCHGECNVIGDVNHRVKCMSCNYESIMDSNRDKVVSAHNRVCRAVKAAK